MALSAVSISKSFGNLQVIKDFSHNFNEPTCLIGPSGCGKTTLLHMLMGLLPPDTGEIKGLSKPAAVFQEDRLLEGMNAVTNSLLATPGGGNTREAEKLLVELGLEGALYKPVRELSGGMRRRVALARAIMSKPEQLFLDEPFKGLDNETKKLCTNAVLALNAALILVTHDDSDALMLGCKIIAV